MSERRDLDLKGGENVREQQAGNGAAADGERKGRALEKRLHRKPGLIETSQPKPQSAMTVSQKDCVSKAKKRRFTPLSMRKKIVILLLIVALGLSYVAFEARNHSEKRRRAELQILRIVETGVLDNLMQGGELPSSWLSLTNMVQWEFVLRMSQDGFIPAATESFTVLSQPIPFESPSGLGNIFFIGTNPKKWPSRSLGRWALLASSNRVFRVWLPENDLPAEIRSQLTNQP